MLQDSQLKEVQQKLAQAGWRSKELAVAVIFARMVLPIVIGGGAALFIYGFGGLGDWSELKRFGTFAFALIGSYKAPDIFVKNAITKRSELVDEDPRSDTEPASTRSAR